MSESASITLAVGQAVPWPPSPTGYAQVEDLHRTHVTIGYHRKGRWRRARVRPEQLTAEPLLFPMSNPFGRGMFPRAKTFATPERQM